MKKQIIRLIAHILDGMFVGAAITYMVMQEYGAALIHSILGVLFVALDVAVVVEEYKKEEK